jgi:site-specific DNA-methyltransferase (adenine-specific)
MINKVYNEPCLDTLKRMADKSIDCVITSPPYWQLRDYGYDGQWGLEPTFNEYLEHLWQLMDEIYRVLKDEGTCWVNLGDTYARGSRNKKSNNNQTLRNTNENNIEPDSTPDYNGLDKCLLLIPHRFAIGCIDKGWIVRNDIIWAKRNGMPESVTDRFTKKHEYIFFMVKSDKYYFNLDEIRDKHKHSNDKRNDGKRHEYKQDVKSQNCDEIAANAVSFNPLGKNPGSVSDFWDVTTKSSSDQHFASYNTDLIKKPILAGCPEGGVIYDPFMGTGTTAIAALRSNRNFIGSEMSSEYIKICENNIKPYLQQTKLF